MLSEIPNHLAKANIYTELHKGVGSERVHQESSKLYVVLLKAVELMLEWLNQKRRSTPCVKSHRTLTFCSTE